MAIFPLTPILDTGAGADASPIAGNWSGPAVTDGQSLRRVSNQIARQTGGGSGASYWNAAQFSGNIEIYFTLPVAGNVNLYWDVDNPALYNNGYILHVQADLMNLRRLAGGSTTTLVSDTAVTISNGDTVGVSHNSDGTITAWHQTGSTLTSVFTYTDTTYTSGYFVIEMNDSTGRITNWGGGTVTAPVVFVEAAFGSQPTDSSYTWTALSQSNSTTGGYVRSFSYSRGRQNERNQSETGTGDLQLRDESSYFDPSNTASPYYPNVKPMVPIRAYAVVAGVTYPMFLHYADRWPRTMRVKTTYTERQLSTVDGFAWLANAGVAGQTYAEETSGDRFDNVLDDVSWPAALRDLDTGNTTVIAATFAADDSTKALQHMLTVNDSENGFAFMNASGQVQLIERHALLLSPYTTSQATFRDATGATGIPYQDVVPSYDLDQVFNEWSGTREGGTTQTATDATSISDYGPRSQQITSLATTDEEVSDQVYWKLLRFKDPLNRVDQLTVMPGTDLSAWVTCLTLEVGDRITVKEKPPGFAAEQTSTYVIQKLSVQLESGPLVTAQFTFQLWPADTNPWLILDDSTYGRLDNNMLSY